MFKRYRQMLLLVGVALVAASAQAATYEIDTAHSQVGFRIRHLVANTRGSFDTFSGTIDFDPAKPAALKASVAIKTESVNTANAKRDEHLRSADFFNVAKFPEMTFKTTSVKSTGNNMLEVVGDLTLLGVTKPVTLKGEITGAEPDPWGGLRAGFSLTGKLNRKDYGMVYNMAMDKGGFVLGDDVEVIIDLEAVSQQKKKK